MSDTEAFLRAFHDARPGATPRALGWGALAGGQSSYEHLAAVVPRRPGVRVLDLACGDGHLRSVLRPDVVYVGVDIAAADLARARQRFPDGDFRRERAQALSVAGGSVDAVLCHMALMLMDDVDAVLSEVARVLAPGGVFAAIVGGPLAGGEAFSIFVELCLEATERGAMERMRLGDRRLRSLETIAPLFADHGFEATVDDDWLILDGNIDAVIESVMLTYDVAWMADETRRDVERAFRERAGAIAAPDGAVPYRLGARRITARAR